MIENVKHVGAELHSNTLGEARIFDNTEIHILHSIGSQNVASGIAKALSWLNAIEIDGKPSHASSRARNPRGRSGEKEIVQRSAGKESRNACASGQSPKISLRRR